MKTSFPQRWARRHPGSGLSGNDRNSALRRLAPPRLLAVLLLWAGWLYAGGTEPREPPEAWLSPSALAASPDGKRLSIACATAGSVLQLDLETSAITQRFKLPGNPSGLITSADGRRLYVTGGAASGWICELDAASGNIMATFAAGHYPLSPTLAPTARHFTSAIASTIA